eukprot:gnl/TRDRNA2_/TRDRNA2_188863_c0_seq1.p1 gnl/TRDRNA2_/TRDRNA2_188863_c0~~gnl/TRDRNA2_/TRDRNA2_188863_c0_seq1.p1  ORF type:complete len:327 (+),score=36.93 gnl/TRDRNA2_/TRDRNA2_188863_c0_seq1:56-1036(+)
MQVLLRGVNAASGLLASVLLIGCMAWFALPRASTPSGEAVTALAAESMPDHGTELTVFPAADAIRRSGNIRYDDVLNRALMPSPSHRAHLDDTALAKTGHVGLPTGGYKPQFLAEPTPMRYAHLPMLGRGVAPAGPRQSGIAGASESEMSSPSWSRRDAAALAAAAAALQLAQPANAERARVRRKSAEKREVPDSDFKPIPGTNPPVLYYDLQGGGGAEGGVRDGTRVAVHFDLKYKRLTIGTSRQGMGVTGGTPYGFDVGVPAGQPGGPFIKAFNVGIRGMGVGGIRRLKVPPEYAYGNQQVQEIPPNSVVTLDIELLGVKRGRF